MTHPNSSKKAPTRATASSSATPANRRRKSQKNTNKPNKIRPMCALCGNTFSKRANLKAHERIHTGEKRYACLVCDRRFVWKSSLNFHTRNAHKEEKTHPPIPPAMINFGPDPTPDAAVMPTYPPSCDPLAELQNMGLLPQSHMTYLFDRNAIYPSYPTTSRCTTPDIQDLSIANGSPSGLPLENDIIPRLESLSTNDNANPFGILQGADSSAVGGGIVAVEDNHAMNLAQTTSPLFVFPESLTAAEGSSR